jgi:hypothetical protein
VPPATRRPLGGSHVRPPQGVLVSADWCELGAAGIRPAHELVVPSQGPSLLKAPGTKGPLLPLVGSAQVLPRVLLSQKIESSVRFESCPRGSPARAARLEPTTTS